MYFSRAAVPYRVEAGDPAEVGHRRHIGVYGFDRATLLAVPDLPSSGLAESEGLEQLRVLENGVRMRVLDCTGDPWGIETRSDYDAFVARVSGAGETT
jgi:3-deoxy-manno-octulosonate cytidylyltransferase (CMP-KDO synthetase)